jgi:drug/metabolite transporter, DME family
MKLQHSISYLMVGLAAALWGCIGIFTEFLNREGFSALEIVTVRVVSAAILLYPFLQLRNPGLLRVRFRDYKYFVGTGILSITFFNWCYFTAINETSLSVAVILLYTGPAFVVILSAILFHEKFTGRKAVSLLLTLAGTVCVAGLFSSGLGSVSTFGIVVGLGAGFGYALYSIFSKFALLRYKPLTIIFYTFLFASLFLLPVTLYTNPGYARLVLIPENLAMIFGLGLVPTVLAYLLYTEGLNRMEAGKASITAMIEPVTATLLGLFLFNEVLTGVQYGGIILVLISITLLHIGSGRNRLRS